MQQLLYQVISLSYMEIFVRNQNQITIKIHHYVNFTYQLFYGFNTRFPKQVLTYTMEVVDPRHKTSQGQAVSSTRTHFIIWYKRVQIKVKGWWIRVFVHIEDLKFDLDNLS